MRLILLSGGAGKRLWPLSNDYRSKQFIKASGADSIESHSNSTSMVQRVWAQLKELQMDRFSIIAASRSQEEILQAQLGDEATLVLEPCKRDTYPAIGLASSYLHSVMHADPNEVAIAMPVDVDADEEYFKAIMRLGEAFDRSGARIGLLGIEPRSASEKFGYILPGEAASIRGLRSIAKFVEKPSADKAGALIEQGALWNCGVFAFRIGDMLERLEKNGWPSGYDQLIKEYERMPAVSFDYEVAEKEEQAVVMPYGGSWNDLGTWDEWTAKLPNRMNGNGYLGDDSPNTHVINELQIPIVVMGVPNVIVAASPDGILVADKQASAKLKDAVQSVSVRPMYEETLYGWYRIVDVERDDRGHQVLTKRVHIWKGKHIGYQMHFHRDELWTIIKGRAQVVINGDVRQVSAGDVVAIRAGTKHAIRAVESIDLIEVQIGESISDEDIVRYAYDWNNRDSHNGTEKGGANE
ncbi:sugar phosphate nucleotidyltransferase [Paenibacillus sp. NPDC058071]|uniref:sugar phosphate nucleotidyltransferase n=1 Tax=Paenibacillus sp. NPDC058071 TaxID=3346326 RepID=UPI0036D96439